MTDKEKLDAIRAEVQNYIYAAHKAHTNITEGNFAHLLSFIDSLQEEPVSKDLEEYINELSKQFPEVSFAKLNRIAVRVAKWQKEQMMSKAIDFIIVDNNAVSTEISTFPYVSLGTEGDTVKLIIINQD